MRDARSEECRDGVEEFELGCLVMLVLVLVLEEGAEEVEASLLSGPGGESLWLLEEVDGGSGPGPDTGNVGAVEPLEVPGGGGGGGG